MVLMLLMPHIEFQLWTSVILSTDIRCTDIHKIVMSWRSSENWMPEPGAQTASICVMAVLWTLSHPVFLVWTTSLRFCADCTEQHFLVNCFCWLCQPQHLFHVTTNIDFSVFVTKHWRYKPHWAGILIRCCICFLVNLVGNPVHCPKIYAIHRNSR